MINSPELTEQELDQLRYPVGKLQLQEQYSPRQLDELIHKIEIFPADLLQVTSQLKKEDLNYRYRPGGWNIREIIHHISDSHTNAYIRIKLALTEENPTVKPYDENKWVLTADALSDDMEGSLSIIKNLHKKMIMILKSVSHKDLERTYYHPDMKRNVALSQLLGIYGWHGHHHLAQINVALEKKFR